MDETKETKAEAAEEKPITKEELEAQLKTRMEELRAKSKEAQEAMSEGKGILTLETPIRAGDEEIRELAYDFTVMTGLDYTEAMDSDSEASQIYRITYRQGLALFAKAAAKQTPRLDMRDILSKIGMTDALEGVQLATLFFSASTRAGRLRIRKL